MEIFCLKGREGKDELSHERGSWIIHLFKKENPKFSSFRLKFFCRISKNGNIDQNLFLPLRFLGFKDFCDVNFRMTLWWQNKIYRYFVAALKILMYSKSKLKLSHRKLLHQIFMILKKRRRSHIATTLLWSWSETFYQERGWFFEV